MAILALLPATTVCRCIDISMVQNPASHSQTPIIADIFCRVIDNFGDIGVCWRLARRLADGHGWRVRLWVDDTAVLRRLAPDYLLQNIDVIHWAAPVPQADPGDVVIEAFACDLPPEFQAKLSARQVWINLEYLSAEDWVEACHMLPSPQGGELRKYFFFPGFTPRTGGLLREPGLLAERDRFQLDPQAQRAFLQSLGLNLEQVTHPSAEPLKVLLFCYANAPVGELVKGLANAAPAVELFKAHGVAPQLTDGQYGNLKVFSLPFIAQDDFDRLLWCCDMNFVRGEDSFVRAQWAGRPMCWQIYPQNDNTHAGKLQAWLQRYPAPAAAVPLHLHWNTLENPQDNAHHVAASLQAALRPEVFQTWQAASREWSEQLAQTPDLADQLVDFCLQRLK